MEIDNRFFLLTREEIKAYAADHYELALTAEENEEYL